MIGEGVNDLPGLWYQDTLQSSTAALQLENEPIYIWAFNGPDITSSVEHAIFSVLDYRWIFPSDTDLPNLTAIDLFQADTADILVGNEGKGTYQGQPLYNLALIDGLATRDLDIVGSGIFNTPILAGTVSRNIRQPLFETLF